MREFKETVLAFFFACCLLALIFYIASVSAEPITRGWMHGDIYHAQIVCTNKALIKKHILSNEAQYAAVVEEMKLSCFSSNHIGLQRMPVIVQECIEGPLVEPVQKVKLSICNGYIGHPENQNVLFYFSVPYKHPKRDTT